MISATIARLIQSPPFPDRLRQSRQVVDSLVGAAKAHAARGNDDAALALVSVAVTVSRRRHTGRFTNAEVEDLLLRLSGRLPASTPLAGAAPLGDEPARDSVLHVMTRCYAAGGHTRLVERWITGRAQVVSSLVLTSPESAEPPATLIEAVQRSGGQVHLLSGTAMGRAGALRALALSSDTVVFAIHENDLVPSLALSAVSDRPPIVIINHADHVFWVGATIADVLVNLRPASADLAVRRRGIPRDRCAVVPLPVSTFDRTMTRDDAKRALGVGVEKKLLVTVGWRYKFTPFAGHDLIAALVPVLADPDVHLIAIGPNEADEPWASAHAHYGSRVRAVGRQADTHTFLEAADVYLDSFPIPSLTATLEAGMFGLPVVGLSLDAPSWPATLTNDDPTLTGHVFADVTEFRERIKHLLSDPVARSSVARSLKLAIDASHGSGEWNAWIDQLRDTVKHSVGPREHPKQRGADRTGPEDVILATHLADSEDRLVRHELRFSPSLVDGGSEYLDIINAGLKRLDSLLLGSAAPRSPEYAAALRISRSMSPWRLQARAMRTALAGTVR